MSRDPARFEYGGRVLLVFEQGRRTGPTFVLVHGIGVASRYFGRLAPLLAEHGRVLTVELPGFGQAPKPGRVQRVEDHGDLLAAYLGSIGCPDAVLVGHSMGTQIVVDAALKHPVGALTLIGPVTDPDARSALRQGGRLLLDMLRESPASNWIVLTDYARCGPSWYLRTLPSMLGYDLERRLPQVTVPATVVRGSRDPIATPRWARRVAALLPTSRLVEVGGAPHVAMFSHPARVAAEILGDVRSAGVP
jgi:pimeloyl-ACP methyl ester carboxylesterase